MKKLIKRIVIITANWFILITIPVWSLPVMIYLAAKKESLMKHFLRGDEFLL